MVNGKSRGDRGFCRFVCIPSLAEAARANIRSTTISGRRLMQAARDRVAMDGDFYCKAAISAHM